MRRPLPVERNGQQKFVITLSTTMHSALRRESLRRSEAEGRRIAMTDIARQAIAKVLNSSR